MAQSEHRYRKLSLDTEWWFENLYEEEVELIERADWPALIRSRSEDLARDPEDPELRLLLAVAYARGGQHDRALALLERLHQEHPDDELVQDYALESLFASGRTEDQFPWVEPPLVARLEEPFFARLHALLLGEERAWPLYDLMLSTAACAYLTFGEEELQAALAADPRFELRQDDGGAGRRPIVRVVARPRRRADHRPTPPAPPSPSAPAPRWSAEA